MENSARRPTPISRHAEGTQLDRFWWKFAPYSQPAGLVLLAYAVLHGITG